MKKNDLLERQYLISPHLNNRAKFKHNLMQNNDSQPLGRNPSKEVDQGSTSLPEQYQCPSSTVQTSSINHILNQQFSQNSKQISPEVELAKPQLINTLNIHLLQLKALNIDTLTSEDSQKSIKIDGLMPKNDKKMAFSYADMMSQSEEESKPKRKRKPSKKQILKLISRREQRRNCKLGKFREDWNAKNRSKEAEVQTVMNGIFYYIA